MSQFAFLQTEWPAAYDGASREEAAANADLRAAFIYARQALETIVRWMFDFDSDFKRPYDRALAALLTASSFLQYVPAGIVAKTNVIRDFAGDSNRTSRRRTSELVAGSTRNRGYEAKNFNMDEQDGQDEDQVGNYPAHPVHPCSISSRLPEDSTGTGH